MIRDIGAVVNLVEVVNVNTFSYDIINVPRSGVGAIGVNITKVTTVAQTPISVTIYI